MNFNYFNVKKLYDKFVKKIKGGQSENVNKEQLNDSPIISETPNVITNNEGSVDSNTNSATSVDITNSQNEPLQQETLVNDSEPRIEESDYNIQEENQTQVSSNEPMTERPETSELSNEPTEETAGNEPTEETAGNERTEETAGNEPTEKTENLNPESESFENSNVETPASQFDMTENTSDQNQSTEILPVIPAIIPNNQNEPYYDSIPYTSKNKTYNYLNRDNLKTTFSGLTERNTNPYTIYLCTYTIILNQYLPFFQYWLINSNNTSYTFPSFEFTLPLHPVNPEIANEFNENENQSSDEDLFTNAYESELKKYYGENIPNFKGFVENENVIYIIFEENNHVLLDEYKATFKPAILHEIINLRKICNVNIDESVSALFKHEYIADIYDENEKIVEYPYLLYLCQGTEGVYSNLKNAENVEVFIPNKILHSSLGYCYLFTSKLLDESETTTKRFVVFIENTLYILNKSVSPNNYHLFDNAEIEENKDDPDCRNYQYSSIYFWEGNTQLWALYSLKYFSGL
jgi:hypothetical protein